MKKFTSRVSISLSDTDATGVIFFPRLFEKCVYVLEQFLKEHKNQSFFIDQGLTFPVFKAQGTYYTPIKIYDELLVSLEVKKIGKSSMEFCYQFITPQGVVAMEAVLIHVCVSITTRAKVELPRTWIELFS